MTKKETIQVLQSIEDRAVDFPYMTAYDWVAIAAAKRHLENSLDVEEVNIADMADDYYDALMEEASVWMDEGTMGHCRLAYYTGCKDVLNKIQKGE